MHEDTYKQKPRSGGAFLINSYFWERRLKSHRGATLTAIAAGTPLLRHERRVADGEGARRRAQPAQADPALCHDEPCLRGSRIRRRRFDPGADDLRVRP